MKAKKIICFILALLMIAGSLTGCSNSNGGNGKKGKHVENLVIGTTTAQNVFNMYRESDAFGRINYVGFCGGNFVYTDDFSLAVDDNNSAVKALNYLCEKYPVKDKYTVFIHKLIPLESGMGGGSSDAAAALRGMDFLSKLNTPIEELKEMALRIGADVPFFIENKPMRCTGIGEIMTPITIKNDYHVLLVKPNEGCSTKEIYAEFDKIGGDETDIDKVIKALEEGDDDSLEKLAKNALEKAAIKTVPEIQVIKDRLKEMGFKIVLMSGSGSTVFALTTNKLLCKKAYKTIFEEGKYFVEMTKVLK